MEFLPEAIEHYCQIHTQAESSILSELNRETQYKILRPRMLSGHLQGQLLKMFSNMIKPKHILEIGTYTGYSAICLAHGLQNGGMLTTIEINPELEDFIKKYISKAGLEKSVKLLVGDALEIIPKLSTEFDMVFIDADKENYINYFEMVFDKVRKGGFIIADNVLWSGKVINPDPKDKETLSIIEFNKHVQEREGIENLMLPFRDGLMIVRKI